MDRGRDDWSENDEKFAPTAEDIKAARGLAGEGLELKNDETSGRGESRTPENLTRNEQMIWQALSAANAPLKAYDLLDMLKDSGVRAPMTVYRALNGLERKGFVHKLESQSAFIACIHDGPHSVFALMVCDACGVVQEVDLEGFSVDLRPATAARGFEMRQAHVEVRGLCDGCDPSTTPSIAAMQTNR
ncbi:MAG: transcriptional repressor [Pseudomonadota bacterium]